METIEEYNYAKNRLMALDKSMLVEALLQLAIESNSASLFVDCLIATKKERVALFHSYIENVTLQANKLTGKQILVILRRALDLLDPAGMEPKIGLPLLEMFYTADSWAFNSTTELDFEFDYLFSEQATNLFGCFAQKCDDKNYVRQMVNRLLSADEYGVRAGLKQFPSLA